MEQEVFVQELIEKSSKLSLNLEKEKAIKFYQYMRFITRMEWKNKFNSYYRTSRDTFKTFYR